MTHYNNLQEFLVAVRNFNKENPNIHWEIHNEPKNLRVGLSAIIDNIDSKEIFTLNLGKLRSDSWSKEDERKIKRAFAVKAELYKAEKEYVNLLLNRLENELPLKMTENVEQSLIDFSKTLK